MLARIAQEYVSQHGLQANTIVKNCRRWDRIIGANPSPDLLMRFRVTARAAGLSPYTIEKTITDVLTIVRHMGTELAPGKRLRQSRPEPQPVPLDSINAIWDLAPHWFRRWLVLTYWTGARCEDSVRLFRMVNSRCECIRMKADKTGHCHVWPAPDWLHDWLIIPSAHPLNGVSLWFTNILRRGITALCEAAKVDRFTPQQLRQRSITEWSRANATAGAIVHGCGLGVLSHYLDPLQILEAAAPRVRLPECFGASATAGTEDALISNFRRLDPAAQGLVAGTAERLAIG